MTTTTSNTQRISFTVRGKSFDALRFVGPIEHWPDGAHQIEKDPAYLHGITTQDGPTWHVYAPTVGDRCALAGLVKYDSAVPEDWLSEHRSQVANRGGWAVWSYENDRAGLFGGPMYADEVTARARAVAGVAIENADRGEGQA